MTMHPRYLPPASRLIISSVAAAIEGIQEQIDNIRQSLSDHNELTDHILLSPPAKKTIELEPGSYAIAGRCSDCGGIRQVILRVRKDYSQVITCNECGSQTGDIRPEE